MPLGGQSGGTEGHGTGGVGGGGGGIGGKGGKGGGYGGGIGGYGSDVSVNKGSFGGGLQGGGQGNFGGTQGGGTSIGGSGKTTGPGAQGSQGISLQSAPQGNTTTVIAPTVSIPSAPIALAPSVPTGGTAPNGSGVIGFPMDGYLTADAQTLDAIDLAELLHAARGQGTQLDGDIGDEYTDDQLSFGDTIAATVRNPIAIIAAVGLVGILALKFIPMKAAA